MSVDDRPNSPDRHIYRYNNGTRNIAADPAVLWRKLNASCSDHGMTWDQLGERWIGLACREGDTPEVASEKSTRWLDLQEVIVRVARNAFNLPELDEKAEGVTEKQVMAVLLGFMGGREGQDEDEGEDAGPSTSEVTKHG